MAHFTTICIAISAVVSATLLFVESVQKPEHRSTWIYRSVSMAWGYLEHYTSPSVVGGIARLLIQCLIRVPEYIAEATFYAYGRVIRIIYPGVGAFIRDVFLPCIMCGLSIALMLKTIIHSTWLFYIFVGLTISLISFASRTIILIIIVLIILICRFPYFIRYRRFSPDPQSRQAWADTLTVIGNGLICLLFFPSLVGIVLASPGIYIVLHESGIPIFGIAPPFLLITMSSYIFLLQVVCYIKNQLSPEFAHLDFDMRVEWAAESIMLPTFYIFLSFVLTLFAILVGDVSTHHQRHPNVFQGFITNAIFDLTAVWFTTTAIKDGIIIYVRSILSSWLVSIYIWTDIAEVGKLARRIYPPLRSRPRFEDSRGVGIAIDMVSIIATNYLFTVLSIFLGVFHTDAQVTVREAICFASGLRPTTNMAGHLLTSCAAGSFPFLGTYFFVGHTIQLPMILGVLFVIALRLVRPVAQISRHMAQQTWALAQPFPLMARLLALLTALIAMFKVLLQ